VALAVVAGAVVDLAVEAEEDLEDLAAAVRAGAEPEGAGENALRKTMTTEVAENIDGSGKANF